MEDLLSTREGRKVLGHVVRISERRENTNYVLTDEDKHWLKKYEELVNDERLSIILFSI
jgi:hypothetical protein